MLPFIIRGDEHHGFFIQAWSLGGALDLLRHAPGNQPPADEPYLCIVPLRDAWRADKALTDRNGVPHFSAWLEPGVMDDLRREKALLVLDLSNEGPQFHPDPLGWVLRFALASGIQPRRVVWLDQNRAMGASYRAHFGDDDDIAAMGFESYDYFLKHSVYQFSPGNATPVVGPAPDKHLARMFDPAAKDKLLLCLNATPRLHRVLTVAGLIHHGLFEDSLVSFFGLDFGKDGDVGHLARIDEYLARHPQLDHLAQACRRVAALQDLKVDSFPGSGNALVDRIDPRPYQRSFFSLVTETDFTAGEVDRVTEKTIKPFCLGHPTMVVGNPNSLRFMTDLGFQSFSHTIDSGYDQETDPPQRLVRILAQLIELSIAIRHNPQAWLGRVREAGAANFRLATSGGALAAYVAMHERPLIERLQRRLNTAT